MAAGSGWVRRLLGHWDSRFSRLGHLLGGQAKLGYDTLPKP